MLIPNKFRGYARDGRRTYFMDGGVGEAAILGSMMEAGAVEAGGAGIMGLEAAGGLGTGSAGMGALAGSGAGAAEAGGAGLGALGSYGAGTAGEFMPQVFTGLTSEVAPAVETAAQVMSPEAFLPESGVQPLGPQQSAFDTQGFENLSQAKPGMLQNMWNGYKGLDKFDKVGLALATSMGLKALGLGRSSVGSPAQYKGGNLQKFKYDPGSFTAAHPFNHGGVASLAVGGAPADAPSNNNAQIHDYMETATTPEAYKALLAKAQAGDYNAMIAMNKLRGTPNQNYAQGGTTLGGYSDGGRMLKGPGDGMSDSIPAQIGGKQPAALADGEFVIPADVVSHLGNGSTDAGAKQLYAMMDRIRDARR